MKKNSKKEQVLQLAQAKGVIRASDLTAKGLPREYLSRLAGEGQMVCEERGCYRLPSYEPSEHHSLVEVSRRIPKGVITLLSALRFHEFTTQNSFEVWVAVENKAYVPKFNYPSVRVVYFSGLAFSAGVMTQTVEGTNVPIFNEAKTVVDCFKYRSKIGLDVALEALREGWRYKRFSVDELYEYATVCRVKNVIQPYFEALV